MKKILAVLVVLLAANVFVSAKMKRFVWDDEICTHEGWYNAARHTEKQLENTYRLWYSQDYELFVRKGERSVDGLMQPVTFEWLDYQYAVKSALLRQLEIVDTPYWQNVKRRKLRALEETYMFERATLEAAENPLVLRRLKFADACLAKYTRAEDLKNAWWDCVNSKITPVDDEGVLQKNFRKLFRRVRELGCDYA